VPGGKLSSESIAKINQNIAHAAVGPAINPDGLLNAILAEGINCIDNIEQSNI
jgi:hypothetical protein